MFGITWALIGLMMPLCSLFLLLPVIVTCTAIRYLRVVNIFFISRPGGVILK